MTLTWYIGGTVQVGTNVSTEHRLPVAAKAVLAYARVKTAAVSGYTQVNIKAGGVSIFDNPLRVDALTYYGARRGFSSTKLAQGAIITLDVDVAGTSAADLTVTLELV